MESHNNLRTARSGRDGYNGPVNYRGDDGRDGYNGPIAMCSRGDDGRDGYN
jgi:hypothetical protein